MLYKLFKIPAAIAFYFYCRYLHINNKDFLKIEGPLLIAANHPNSFLDAIVLATIFKKPIWSLARGDAFVNPFIKKILTSFNMLPVYRVSEGAGNLQHNYSTFSACNDIFKKNGIVLIFTEGRCVNEWHLRPLKKGTARLALEAWKQDIPLRILPLGINYSNFRRFGKNIFINFGDIISAKDIPTDVAHGNAISNFNSLLNLQLKRLVYECDSHDEKKLNKLFNVPQSTAKRVLLYIPAVLGWLLHLPLYVPVILSIKNKANDHYDSVLVGLLFFLYPVYLIIITIFLHHLFGIIIAALSFLLLPFCARSLLQLKRQIYT
ncbi:hypothetical protein BH09BAC2_BH09BAC2_08500 [soil metagenome]